MYLIGVLYEVYLNEYMNAYFHNIKFGIKATIDCKVVKKQHRYGNMNKTKTPTFADIC